LGFASCHSGCLGQAERSCGQCGGFPLDSLVNRLGIAGDPAHVAVASVSAVMRVALERAAGKPAVEKRGGQ